MVFLFSYKCNFTCLCYSLKVEISIKMDMAKFLCLFFIIILFKSQFVFAFLNTSSSSQIPSAICKIIAQLTEENPETRTIFFGTSYVNLSTDVIEDSLKCAPTDIPVITTEIMTKNSKIIGNPAEDTDLSLDKSTIVVIFVDSLKFVRKNSGKFQINILIYRIKFLNLSLTTFLALCSTLSQNLFLFPQLCLTQYFLFFVIIDC